ncbi:MAG: chorismate synthase [Phycisphaeraceae bacterium]|nr:chorismate synthase [Phycisphaeraceae bacterium]
MPVLDYQTAGESHGPALVITITGLPAGLDLDVDFINAELLRRQGGYGRGGRQRIEQDRVEFLTGVRQGRTIAAPLTMVIRNNDSRLDDLQKTPPVYRPRPGHADLAGSVKWLTTDCRETLERASARETASRVAAGAVARCLLREFGIEAFGFVRSILDAKTDVAITDANWQEMKKVRDASETYCPDEAVTAKQCEIIRQAKVDKDTVGGLVEAHVFGCPIGLGSCMNWTTKLDARLAYAVMGIQAFKAVEIGLGKECAFLPGHKVHDPIRFDAKQKDKPHLGFVRDSNNAGGTEGGMTNGMPVVVRGTMKPIATLLRGMPSVDLNTKESQMSSYERSDVCAVSAASVVLENVAAFEVARVFSEKFSGDSLTEVRAQYDAYMRFARMLPLEPPIAVVAKH